MMRALLLVIAVASCAQMKRDWEAQQRANAAAAAAAQPANLETLCKGVQSAYCAHCGVDQAACSQTYITCLGGRSPADPSAFTMGQVDQCGADVQAGDCNVMPSVWPASCSTPTQVATPSCGEGTTWDGAQCVATAPAASTCSGGAVWDAAQNQCVCTAGTQWDGAQCVQAAQPAPRRVHCRDALLDKGYGPDQLGGCKGVDDRCAVAAIARGYGPDQLGACRGVDGRCAEDLIARGYGMDQLGTCRR